jgi:hypothetical protein
MAKEVSLRLCFVVCGFSRIGTRLSEEILLREMLVVGGADSVIPDENSG